MSFKYALRSDNFGSKLDNKSFQPPYILGHYSKSIRDMESYDISVDAQSNCSYEYYVSVLIGFLINPDIEYGARAQTKKLHKIPCVFAPSIQWYGLFSIWWQDLVHTSNVDWMLLSLMYSTPLLIVEFELMGEWWWGGVVIGVLFHSVQFAMAVERLIVSRIVKLSNLDCLFQATNITDLYLFLADDCGYIPQWSIKIPSGIQRHWCWAST